MGKNNFEYICSTMAEELKMTRRIWFELTFKLLSDQKFQIQLFKRDFKEGTLSPKINNLRIRLVNFNLAGIKDAIEAYQWLSVLDPLLLYIPSRDHIFFKKCLSSYIFQQTSLTSVYFSRYKNIQKLERQTVERAFFNCNMRDQFSKDVGKYFTGKEDNMIEDGSFFIFRTLTILDYLSDIDMAKAFGDYERIRSRIILLDPDHELCLDRELLEYFRNEIQQRLSNSSLHAL